MRFSFLSLTTLLLPACFINNFVVVASNNNNLRKLSGDEESSEESSSEEEGPTFLEKIEYPYDPWLPVEGDARQRLFGIPSLSQPYYNNVIDVRATVSAKDVELIVSTAGNWQYGLTTLLDTVYFPNNPSVQNSYLITTSPPISVPQMREGRVKVGNILYTNAQPHIAIGPPPLMDVLDNLGFSQGPRIPILRNYGNVILRLKGNTKVNEFKDLFDLEPGRFASSGPAEGATNNYRTSIQNIILNNPNLVDDDATLSELDAADKAAELLERLFDTSPGVCTIGPPMHQSVPHCLITGQADAGLMFLELAVRIMINNPGIFEAIYLSKDKVMGTLTDDPIVLAQGQDPLDGMVVPLMFVTRTTTPVNEAQDIARENFITALQSEEFQNTILPEVGLRSPPILVPV